MRIDWANQKVCKDHNYRYYNEDNNLIDSKAYSGVINYKKIVRKPHRIKNINLNSKFIKTLILIIMIGYPINSPMKANEHTYESNAPDKEILKEIYDNEKQNNLSEDIESKIISYSSIIEEVIVNRSKYEREIGESPEKISMGKGLIFMMLAAFFYALHLFADYCNKKNKINSKN